MVVFFSLVLHDKYNMYVAHKGESDIYSIKSSVIKLINSYKENGWTTEFVYIEAHDETHCGELDKLKKDSLFIIK